MILIGALLLAVSALANPLSSTRDSANERLISNLLRGAIPTEDSQLHRHVKESDEFNIASYAVKFEQCQFINSHKKPKLADSESATDVIVTTKQFVLFRLCPDTDCSSSCKDNYYGEYLVDLERYLKSTVEYFRAEQDEKCQTCSETCHLSDIEESVDPADTEADAGTINGVGTKDKENNQDRKDLERGKDRPHLSQFDCTNCLFECDKIENMQSNGYIDATEFLECTLIYDPEDESEQVLYAGPVCADNGARINIGVFTDADCMVLDAAKDVDDYLILHNVQAWLSHALLKRTYRDTCVSCQNQRMRNENGKGDKEQKETSEAIELCERLYSDSVKCEKRQQGRRGNDKGSNDSSEGNNAQQTVVCELMASLKDAYKEADKIVV